MTKENSNIEFIVRGEIPSLKNDLRVGLHGQFYHNKDHVNTYKRIFQSQTPLAFRKLNITEPVKVSLSIYLKNRRKDGHNAEAVIFDCLQDCGIIKNDRLIEEWHGQSFIDKTDPRVLIRMERL